MRFRLYCLALFLFEAFAGKLHAQALNYVPRAVGIFYTVDGTGSGGTWAPFSGAGGGGTGGVSYFSFAASGWRHCSLRRSPTLPPRRRSPSRPVPASQGSVLAGPASGGTGAYSFRALVPSDIPALAYDLTGAAATAQANAIAAAANASNLSSGTVSLARLPSVANQLSSASGCATAGYVYAPQSNSCVAQGSGGGAVIPSNPTSGNTQPLLYNNGGAIGNATAVIVRNSLATEEATVLTGVFGTGPYMGVPPAIPGCDHGWPRHLPDHGGRRRP